VGLGGIGVSVSGAMETGPRGGPCVPERRGSEDDGVANIVMTSAMAVAARAPGLKPARTLGSVQHNAHFRQFRRGPFNATTPQHGSRYRMDEVLEALIAAPMQTAAPLALTLNHSLTHSLTHPLTHSLAPLALAPWPPGPGPAES
jgi:hypothetical protein